MVFDISSIDDDASLIRRARLETELTMIFPYIIQEADIVERESCWNSYHERLQFPTIDDSR